MPGTLCVTLSLLQSCSCVSVYGYVKMQTIDSMPLGFCSCHRASWRSAEHWSTFTARRRCQPSHQPPRSSTLWSCWTWELGQPD